MYSTDYLIDATHHILDMAEPTCTTASLHMTMYAMHMLHTKCHGHHIVDHMVHALHRIVKDVTMLHAQDDAYIYMCEHKYPCIQASCHLAHLTPNSITHSLLIADHIAPFHAVGCLLHVQYHVWNIHTVMVRHAYHTAYRLQHVIAHCSTYFALYTS